MDSQLNLEPLDRTNRAHTQRGCEMSPNQNIRGLCGGGCLIAATKVRSGSLSSAEQLDAVTGLSPRSGRAA
jgi:hypothetical protein